MFPWWPEQGPPPTTAFLAFTRETVLARHTSHSPVLVCCSSSGTDASLFYVSLDAVLGQIRATGDANLAHYSRTVASTNGLALSSVDMYAGLHDMLAVAIQTGVQTELSNYRPV